MDNIGQNPTGQNDIDDLLDSALLDFDKVPRKKKTNHRAESNSQDKELADLLQKVGLVDQAEDDKQTMANLSRLAKDNSEMLNEETNGKNLQETLLQLSKDSDSLKDLPTEEEMNRLFEGFSDENLEEGLGNLLPMMEGMMQSLLSKDLLYPAMKDMNDKYPDWLADNRDKLSDDEYTRYNKQFDLTRKICHEFEAETDSSSQAEKSSRFERIMELMQAMQDLGQPPKEIVGEAGFPTNGMENPFSGGQENCTIS